MLFYSVVTTPRNTLLKDYEDFMTIGSLGSSVVPVVCVTQHFVLASDDNDHPVLFQHSKLLEMKGITVFHKTFRRCGSCFRCDHNVTASCLSVIQRSAASSAAPPSATTSKAKEATATLAGVPRSSVHADAATVKKVHQLKEEKTKVPQTRFFLIGAPFVLFSVMGAWVVANAIEGRLKEREVSKGQSSKSLRQAALETEHEEMMERLNKIVSSDYDNTRRIKRPHEILEERRLEREKRNAWHRRAYRAIFGEKRKE